MVIPMSGFALLDIERLGTGFLTQRVSLRREIVSIGELGEQVSAWETLSENIPARFVTSRFDRNQSLSEVAAQEAAPEVYSVILPIAAPTAQVKDELVMGGRSFRIMQVNPAVADRVFQRVQVVAHD